MGHFKHEKSAQKSKLFRSLWRGWFALLALVTVCVLCDRLTTAWYEENQQAAASDNITSAAMELAMGEYDIYYYPKRGEACQKTTYSGNSISMMSYDTLLDNDDRNSRTAVLFVIPVSGEALTQDTASFSIVLTRAEHTQDTAQTTQSSDSSEAYLSDYVTVRCAVGPQDLVQAADADTYQAIKDYLEEKAADTNDDRFTAYSFEKQQNSLTFTFSPSDYQDYVDENETVYVYMEIDYNPDVVKKYVSDKQIVIKFGHESQLEQFQSDLSEIALVPTQEDAS